ncbi:RNA ligase [Halocatena pleomorpha]|uniref:RNA ligase n=1 Tax=Halocatena pleomorpha TaxID=1785090 RepID=A0A3P3R8H2_9EURY|nr:RNA ligase [Halocatena pleomorpha]RRJ29674.1 RNA ligase [Halocatena pleomorpha]
MDDRECFDRLDSTASDTEDLFEHFERRTAADRTYHALPNARHGIERGTVVVEDTVVRGYPKIPRILVLDTGIPTFFENKLAVEEKLDGVNVRIANVNEPLAFTRSGYICPYTTARAKELLAPNEFFCDHPEQMLCAELVGPETPYTTHDYEEIDSHTFCVFDIRDCESGKPLSVSDRRRLCVEYGFPQPRLFGRYRPPQAVDGVRDAIETLDAAAREGVVMKTLHGEKMAKYTTESQHHEELAYAFSLPFDRGREFVFSRLVREAFQAAEFEADDDQLRERAHRLGEAILLPMVETIRDAANDKSIGERFTVRGSPQQIDALLEHLYDQSLTLEIDEITRENDEQTVEFVKVAEATRDQIHYYLEHGIHRD